MNGCRGRNEERKENGLKRHVENRLVVKEARKKKIKKLRSDENQK
jgi:hypothetical protein